MGKSLSQCHCGQNSLWTFTRKGFSNVEISKRHQAYKMQFEMSSLVAVGLTCYQTQMMAI